MVYRDFNDDHEDFQTPLANNTVVRGLLDEHLVNGKPVFIGEDGEGAIADAESFSDWYRHVPNINAEIASEFSLWHIGDGAYVNRYGANGEQWEDLWYRWCGYSTTQWREGNSAPCAGWPWSDTIPCDKDRNGVMDSDVYLCIVEETGNLDHTGVFFEGYRDGNPLYFPIDDPNVAFTPYTDYAMAIPPAIYSASNEPGRDPSGATHNFHFTSEIHFSFYYDNANTYRIQFTGDDDAWIFINGTIAIDLGGIHNPANGAAVVNAFSAGEFGISENGVYEVAIFHAERNTNTSSYRLTLTGFDIGASVCTPVQ